MLAARVEPNTATAATAERPSNVFVEDFLRALRAGAFSKRKISIMYCPFFNDRSYRFGSSLLQVSGVTRLPTPVIRYLYR